MNISLPDAKGEPGFFLPSVSVLLTQCSLCLSQLSPIADPMLSTSNNSLKALQATMGNSYKCNTEEHIFVSKVLSLNVFSVQVQAFKVDSDRFGSGK